MINFISSDFRARFHRGPHPFSSLAKAACVLAISMAGALNAWAQSATAQLQPNPLRIDAYARYSIRIENGAPSEQPLLQLPPEIQVVPGSVGTQRQITIVNGQQKDFITFIWTLTVDREGEFVIPPQEVTLTGNQKVQTNEVKVVVNNQATTDDQRLVPTLTLEVGKVKFYEGEQVPVTARLTTHRQSQIRRFHLIEMPKQDFAMQRFPLQAQESLSQIGGEQYIVRDYTTQMNALKPGTYELGPASMDIVYEIPDPAYAASGARSLFVPTQTQSTKAKSNTVRVEVLPLPKENRPESFKGAIGHFRLRAQATPTSLKVGEPISVDIEIIGAGNFDALSAPEMANAKDWRLYPSKRIQLEQKQDVSDASSSLGFSQVIIPTSVQSEIPAYELTYFDPETGQYITARSEPIPIQVEASEASPPATSASAAEASSPIAPSTPEVAPPARVELNDIVEIDLNSLPKSPRSSPLMGALRFSAAAIVILLIPYALFMYLRGRSHQTEHLQAAKIAKALRALNRSSSSTPFYQSLLSYLDLVDDQSPAAREAREKAYAYLYHPDPQSLKEISKADRTSILKSLNL